MSKYYFFDIFIFRTKRFRISSLVLSAIIHFFFRFRTLSIKHKKRYLQYVNTSSIYGAFVEKFPNKTNNNLYEYRIHEYGYNFKQFLQKFDFLYLYFFLYSTTILFLVKSTLIWLIYW